MEVILFPIIIQEILQGIREDEKFVKIKSYLNGFEVKSINQVEAAIGAASLYRVLRKKGITIRKPNDCMIAFLAITFNLSIVHDDSDFDLIALGSNLKILKFD
jgi:predicted nucleic acid-binding protein